MDLDELAVVMPAHQCPVCGTVFDRATVVGQDTPRRPEAGDATICAACLAVNIFQAHGSLRRATVEEAREAQQAMRPYRPPARH